MIGELLETATTCWVGADTCGIRPLTTAFLDFATEFNGFTFMRSFEIETVNVPPDDEWLVVTMVVVDGEFTATGVELGMFTDGMVAVPVGAGLDMAGVGLDTIPMAGLDVIPMAGLIDVMDSKCRPSSISTESALFWPARRALGLR
jgi:hypothetical protein